MKKQTLTRSALAAASIFLASASAYAQTYTPIKASLPNPTNKAYYIGYDVKLAAIKAPNNKFRAVVSCYVPGPDGGGGGVFKGDVYGYWRSAGGTSTALCPWYDIKTPTATYRVRLYAAYPRTELSVNGQ